MGVSTLSERTGADVIAAAEQVAARGYSYRLDPPPSLADGTIDCSLYVLEVAKAAGVALGPGIRTAEQIRQATAGPVGWADVRPGDLLFFEYTYPAAGPAGPDGRIASHVGISLGAGTHRMLDAHERDGADVAVTDVSPAYWQEKLIEARRLPGLVAAAPAPAPGSDVRGIDVASHQGAVEWPAVAASGVAFALTKATGGTWYRNPTFLANWLGIRSAGLVRGAYHYAFESSGQPLPGDGPEAEAEYFLAELARGGGVEAGDVLALDLEDGEGRLGAWALRWLRRVEDRAGVRPILYTGGWFAGPHGLGEVPALAEYPLWLAAYQDALPPAPAPWRSVAIWQHSDRGSVPGVGGGVDLNRAFVPLASLGKGGQVAVLAPAYHRDGDVGTGILDAMRAAGTVPAAPSTFLPLGRSPAVIEECVSLDGTLWRWHLPTGKLWMYPAA